jgi:hypothetical protein
LRIDFKEDGRRFGIINAGLSQFAGLISLRNGNVLKTALQINRD